MTFTIHLIFTFLKSIIFRPLFDEITIHGNVKITFFMKSTWYRRWCLMNFFSSLHFSRIHCNFMLITFLNGLPHSKHVSSQDVCLIYSSSSPILASTATLCSSLFSMVYDILHNFIFHLLLNIFNILHMLCYGLHRTCTDSWSFVRCPFRFTSTSLCLQVWYFNHFLMKSQYMEMLKLLFTAFYPCFAIIFLEKITFLC